VPVPAGIVGHIVDVGPDGQARIEFEGNAAGPLPARTIFNTQTRPTAGAAVLIVFENGDPMRPIILGYPRDGVASAVTTATVSKEQPVALTVRSFVVEAGQEIVLRCGQGSITLCADGTVVVRGTRLLSRASGTNRIRGAAVRIN
jgi:hypothetical protein